jgi:AbrB family looped-hinge helix DNA binding protein
MKNTSVIRKLDELGRLVLPKDVRKKLNIRKGDFLELIVEKNVLNIRKYSYLKEVDTIAKLLIESVYEIYGVDAVLLEGDNIIASRENSKAGLKKIKEDNYPSSQIVFDGSEIGKLVVLDSSENANQVLTFASLFLKKYLED